MAWMYLLLAGLFEIIWTTALKYSNGFTRIIPVVVILVSGSVSLYLLSVAMKSIPLGTSYAVWTGIGSIGAAIIGIMFFNDSVNFGRLFSFVLVILGIVGLKVFTN
ncbi:Small multidrug resistance protein [Wolbachia endosymbiont of Drosophila simulans wNo]|uniref:DMT family transporter n=2 Tax=Wolbachia TaxID=953 RepID=UPI0002D2512B|nr:multidrug efflux SMR transporter [Wolbachia endosymbiont of Drosophila simulans]QCB63081.1 multidrug efflux SMR transporter [Wolbachia endosymbiont of Drosophila mauritiana]AGJ98920.1 Small multidrug resistance protein [Wolbachia endosymbiont of Drosophila simulans wNo]QCB64126.1 multidrug efflux SMR transporter [Wolbachia endosymbiont of Drosophila mauritiana]QWE33572.1 Small multidrug resistance protein [Wolbachia endosymbiont of Drosophila simulans]TGB05912.1 multidrug efflux SMR transpo